jgi:hypothetical protein
MNFSTDIFDFRNIKKYCEFYSGKRIKISILKPDRKNIASGNLRIIFVRENEVDVEFLLSYEDYVK